MGNTQSIFGNLGSGLGNIVAKKEYGIDRFLIKHIFEVLENPRCNDANSLQRVKYFLSKLEKNQFYPIITLYSYSAEEYLLDGNKSATALYNFNIMKKIENIYLPIFIVEC